VTFGLNGGQMCK